MDDTMMKGPSQAIEPRTSIELANAKVMSEKQGTSGDLNDMDRMGKIQVLKRQFKFMSIFGYAVVLGATWEYALLGVTMSLFNGGTAGGLWMLVVVIFGMTMLMLSMAEMVSMMPISGGQYHWVSELAPAKHQKFLSYLVGFLCVASWQTGMAGTAYGVAQQFQGLIALNMPSYEIQGWHGTLFSIGVTMFSILWNTLLVKKLPLVEGIGLVLHVFGFFAFVVVLWVMGPRTNTKDVWTKFEDPSGWGSNAAATLVGILGPMLTIGGADLSCHLAEEVEDSSYVQPRAMVATAMLNYSLGFIMTVTLFSTLGDNPTDLVMTPIGQPWIQMLLNATGSRVATTIMVSVVCLLLLFCTINQVTSSSRQLWSFARDGGLPFAAWLGHVPEGQDIPVNAVLFTLFSTALLSLIIIGSSIAFNIILSLGFAAGFTSYIIVLSCMIRKRLVGEPLLPCRFSLGKWGLIINSITLAYVVLAYVLIFFPTIPAPALIDMNWTIVMYSTIVAFSLVYYYFQGRFTYKGPVTEVKQY